MDAAAFLGETGKGNKTRVVGRIRPDKNSKALEMLILSVWEIDWEDVGIAEDELIRTLHRIASHRGRAFKYCIKIARWTLALVYCKMLEFWA
ncbi:MAG: hypothetical protein LQ351_000883 [Letrouitia transgressa]|nr:MAG: hypothetical protein LQ351_000883 [Letrouitia transgressa]